MSITTVPTIIYPPLRATDGTTVTLDAAEEFIAHVIRIPKTGTLNKIGWRVMGITGSSYTIKVSLETVAETVGQPVATSNAAKTLYASGAESADLTSLTQNTVTYTALNGETGVSVTAGDLATVTIRLTAVSGSSVGVRSYQGVTGGDMVFSNQSSGIPYSATYLGSSWTTYQTTPMLALEYSDGICPTPVCLPPVVGNALQYNSGSTTVYYGAKFRYPFKCRLYGMYFNCDLDSNVQIIFYGSDEYTAFSGFPITLDSDQRSYTAARNILVVFPTKATIEANTDYRVVVVPTTTTNITLGNNTHTADGSYSGLDAYDEGDDFVLTYRAGAPSSGDHAWTDSTTDKPAITLLIDGIESSSGGGGSIFNSGVIS